MKSGLCRTVAFIAVVLVSVSIAAPSSRAEGLEPMRLRIATTPIDTGAQALYALDLGFFKKAGLDVDVSIVNNGSVVAAAVAGGTYDIGQSNVPALAAARQHGLPFVMLAPSSVYSEKAPSTAAILVAKNSTIHTARDLDGKTIAVAGLLGIGQVTTAMWIDKNGGDSSTVKWVELPFSAMSAALSTGRVDAAESAYPAIDEALAAGHRILDAGYEATAPQFAIGGWFCTTDFVKAHPDVAQRFVAVMLQTARWANTHHAESAKILEKWSNAAVPATMPRVIYGERVSLAEVQPLIDVSVRYNALKGPMPAAELVAPEVVPGAQR